MDLKGEIFSIQLHLWWGRGVGVVGQCSIHAPSGLLESRLSVLVEIFFFWVLVSPRTGANTHLKDVLSQQITTGVLQRDEGDDGLPVHASQAGAVTHEVVMNDGTVRVHIRWLIGHSHTMLKCIFVMQILGT